MFLAGFERREPMKCDISIRLTNHERDRSAKGIGSVKSERRYQQLKGYA